MSPPVVWALSAAAPAFDANSREQVERSIAALHVLTPGAVRLTTCHRAEIYGGGVVPAAGRLPRDNAARAAALLVGTEAVRHLCRLATGLESAVVGEQQVLHQLRAALRRAEATGLDPAVARTWHAALWAGRRARSGHGSDGPPSLDLGDLAVRWLDRELGGIVGRRVLVVGNGAMGRALVRATEARGAIASVATRRPEAGASGRRMLSLTEAVHHIPKMDALAVALGGPWAELDAHDSLPATVDLSFPAAIPADIRGRATRFADVDSLAASRGDLGPQTAGDADRTRAYRARAEQAAEDAAARVAAWFAARPSTGTIRELRARAEADRRRALDRLFRRLPDLDGRERELVGAMAQQLVATVLHRPTAALGSDTDGSAAAAADRLFGP